MAANTIQRKIRFYRALVKRADPRQPRDDFTPERALRHIDGLDFEEGARYYIDRDRILCVWVDNAREGKLRFASIRREDLPRIENAGKISGLRLGSDEGLVETSHVRCFGNSIVGCDFNFYGPRLPALRDYLRHAGGPDVQDVKFVPLSRKDVSRQLANVGALKSLTVRVRRADLDKLSRMDTSLADAFEAQASLGNADEYEITVRAKARSSDSDLGDELLSEVRSLAENESTPDVLKALKVDVFDSSDGRQEINLLDDHLVVEKAIKRQAEKSRAVKKNDAYAAIEEAYEDIESELLDACSVDVYRADEREIDD